MNLNNTQSLNIPNHSAMPDYGKADTDMVSNVPEIKKKKGERKTVPMAMKLRFSCTLRQDTSVGLFPGMAGNIRVHRGLPLSLLSVFHTLT